MCFHGTIRLGEQATRERRLLFSMFYCRFLGLFSKKE